jgi:predicted oxidoreductase (fatty acid repression mutant protein)
VTDTPQARRSIYALEPKSTLTDQQLRDVVTEAVKFTPTSFNMQQTRAVLVIGEAKNRVWDAVKGAKMRNESGQYLWS